MGPGLIGSLACVWGCSAPPVDGVPTPARRPNIVLILADDLGFADLGCYGSEIATPHLDRLAASGLRFTQFYNAARCCPTRASLLTGLYPHQAGVGFMDSNFGRSAYQGYLNDSCVTIAEALQRSGYQTLMSGKWHVGERRPNWPVDRGFAHSFAMLCGERSYFPVTGDGKLVRDDRPWSPSADGFYMTDAITDHATTFLDEHGRSDRPFFLYLAYSAPHWPLHAWPADIDRYRGKYRAGWDALRRARYQRQIEMGLIDAAWALTPRDKDIPTWESVSDPHGWDLRMAVYAAQIDRMDQGIGKVLAKLSELGVEQDTLVLFLSDNGACAEEIDRGKGGAPPGPADSFQSYGRAWAQVSNTPFRLYKHWVHEGGIATPLIAHWPRMIRRPGLTHQPGHLIDIMATCLDVAGADYPRSYKKRPITPLEGRSLVPIFQGQVRAGHEALFWEHEGNRAVRQGQWKLVSRYQHDWELYDLAADRTEMNDLADQHPELVQELAAKYEQWAERCGVLPWEKVRPPHSRFLNVARLPLLGVLALFVLVISLRLRYRPRPRSMG